MKRFLGGWAILGLYLGAMGHARSDFMYFSEVLGGTIQRANLDGTAQTTLVGPLTTGPVGPALDIAGGKMYWTENFSGHIRRANLDGTGQETLVSDLDSPGAPALDLAGGQKFDRVRSGMTLKELMSLLGEGSWGDSHSYLEGCGILAWACQDGRRLYVWPTTGRPEEVIDAGPRQRAGLGGRGRMWMTRMTSGTLEDLTIPTR